MRFVVNLAPRSGELFSSFVVVKFCANRIKIVVKHFDLSEKVYSRRKARKLYFTSCEMKSEDNVW